MQPNYYQSKFGLLSDGTTIWKKKLINVECDYNLNNLVTSEIISNLDSSTKIKISEKWFPYQLNTDIKINNLQDVLKVIDIFLDCYKNLFEQNIMLCDKPSDELIQNYFLNIWSYAYMHIFDFLADLFENQDNLREVLKKYDSNFTVYALKNNMNIFDYQANTNSLIEQLK